MFRSAYNFLVVSFFMLLVLVYGVITDLLVWDEVKRSKLRAGFLHRIARVGSRMIGIRINHTGDTHSDVAHFIVSNHLSYLDIVVISSIYRTVFVSTTEVGSAKFFGRLAKYGGSLFIDRKNRLRVKQDMENIKTILENHTSIVIFLEGTTSNGDGVLPFKSSFLEVVFQTGKPVLGLCIKYRLFNGKPVDEKTRDLIYYYGDHKLASHLTGFLASLRTLDVEVKEVGLFFTQDYPSRKELATQLHQKISDIYAS